MIGFAYDACLCSPLPLSCSCGRRACFRFVLCVHSKMPCQQDRLDDLRAQFNHVVTILHAMLCRNGCSDHTYWLWTTPFSRSECLADCLQPADTDVGESPFTHALGNFYAADEKQRNGTLKLIPQVSWALSSLQSAIVQAISCSPAPPFLATDAVVQRASASACRSLMEAG
jgi:hypothetical protein